MPPLITMLTYPMRLHMTGENLGRELPASHRAREDPLIVLRTIGARAVARASQPRQHADAEAQEAHQVLCSHVDGRKAEPP